MINLNFLEKLLEGVEVKWKPLGEIADLTRGRVISKEYLEKNKGIYPVYSSQTANNGMIGSISTFDFDGEYVNWTTDGSNAGTVFYRTGKFSITNVSGLIKLKKCTILSYKFLFYWLSIEAKKHVYSGMGNPKLMSHQVEKIYIPILCPENPEKSQRIQAEIVRVLDSYSEHITELLAKLTKERTARKKQYDYFRDKLLSFKDGEFEWKSVGDVFDIYAGGDVPKNSFSTIETDEFSIPILSNGIDDKALYGWTDNAKIIKPSLTISARGTIGWTSYRYKPFYPIIRLLVLTPKININLRYAYYYMKAIENDYNVSKNGIPQLTKPMIKDIRFPIPYAHNLERSLFEQSRIVFILDKFYYLNTTIIEELSHEIELHQKKYEYYRNMLLGFPERRF